MTDGDIRDRDGDGINERVDENGNQKILYQMADRLDQILNPDKGSEAGLLTKDGHAPSQLAGQRGVR